MALTRVQLPSTANLSIAQFGEALERRGFIIEQLTELRLQAQAPRSVVSDILPVERWFPAARTVVERSATGFTISYRPSIRRIAVASVGSALLFFTSIPATLATRGWLAGAAAALLVIVQLRSARRHRTFLTIDHAVPEVPTEVQQ